MSKYGYIRIAENGQMRLEKSNNAEFTKEELKTLLNADDVRIVRGRVTNMLICFDKSAKVKDKGINKLASKLSSCKREINGQAIIGTSFFPGNDPDPVPGVRKLDYWYARRAYQILETMTDD